MCGVKYIIPLLQGDCWMPLFIHELTAAVDRLLRVQNQTEADMHVRSVRQAVQKLGRHLDDLERRLSDLETKTTTYR